MDRWMSARTGTSPPAFPGQGENGRIGIYYFQENYREGGEA